MNLTLDIKFLEAAKSLLTRAEACGNTTAREALRIIEVELPDLLSQGGSGTSAFTFFHEKLLPMSSTLTFNLAKSEFRSIYNRASRSTGDRRQEDLCVSAVCAYATLVVTQLRQVLVAAP